MAKASKPKASSVPLAPSLPRGFALKIEPRVPADMVADWSNYMLVVHDERRFYLHFFQAIPPILGSDPFDPESARRALEEMGGLLPATCISRIVVEADKMGELVGALNRNWEIWNERFGKRNGDSDDGAENVGG